MCKKKSSKQKYNKNVVLFVCTSLVLLPHSCDTRTLTSCYTRRLSLIRDIRYVTIVLLLLKCKWHTFLPNKSTYTRDTVHTHFYKVITHFLQKTYKFVQMLYKCCTMLYIVSTRIYITTCNINVLHFLYLSHKKHKHN